MNNKVYTKAIPDGTKVCVGQDSGNGDIAVVQISPLEHKIVYLDDDAIIWTKGLTAVVQESFFRDGFIRKYEFYKEEDSDLEIKKKFEENQFDSKNIKGKIYVRHYSVILDVDGSEQIVPESLIRKI